MNTSDLPYIVLDSTGIIHKYYMSFIIPSGLFNFVFIAMRGMCGNRGRKGGRKGLGDQRATF